MKARSGFILRNLVGEYVLMPVDDNIRSFSGSVLMNELSAFVWEKLQTPVTRDELLTEILDAYEVDAETASADLDQLLEDLNRLGMIEP